MKYLNENKEVAAEVEKLLREQLLAKPTGDKPVSELSVSHDDDNAALMDDDLI
jgi:hypothetical protein